MKTFPHIFSVLLVAFALSGCTGIDASTMKPAPKPEVVAQTVEPASELDDIWILAFPIEGDPEAFMEAFNALPEDIQAEVFSDCFYIGGCSAEDLTQVAY